GMGMGMGMGMMGMGGYGMGGGLLSMFRNAGTSDIELRQKAQMLGDLYWTDRITDVDPSKIDQKLTIEEKIIVVKDIIDKIEQYKTYQKYYKDELIPPEVIEKFNQNMENSNQDYYIKRSLTMDLNADYSALMNYMYDIEYGPRVQTINSLNITNQENGQVNVVMEVESHTLENVAEESEEGTTGGVSMR
ncbi:MAG: hypothetical protein JXR73_13395, partial [Candidatus Omnitrophica bacterium]|nr:hypothetical protein [Candidatus Omnitrophota bacterium]